MVLKKWTILLFRWEKDVTLLRIWEQNQYGMVSEKPREESDEMCWMLETDERKQTEERCGRFAIFLN